jgi:hypothetical protein
MPTKTWKEEVTEAKAILDRRSGAQAELARYMGTIPQRLTEIFRVSDINGRVGNPRVDRLNTFRAGIEKEKAFQKQAALRKQKAESK